MNIPFLHTDHELWQRIAEGDESSFRQLFEQNHSQIYGVAFAFTKSSVLAEELVQDIFLKIWLKRAVFTSVKQPDRYLFTLVRNHILNVLRKKIKEDNFTKQLSEYFLKNEFSPEDQFILKESEQVIDKAVDSLPPRQRLIYQLSRQQGLSQEDIALQLHISKHTVKSHMNKALQAIRNYVQPHIEGMSR